MPTNIYLITSITQSGGSANYDYVIDTGTTFNGTFSYGPAVVNDGDDLFEGGEQLFIPLETRYTSQATMALWISMQARQLILARLLLIVSTALMLS